MTKSDYWCYFAWCREYMRLDRISEKCNIPAHYVESFIAGNMEALDEEQLSALYDSIKVITQALETIA